MLLFKQTALYLVLSFSIICVVSAQSSCHNLGNLQVFYDPSCSVASKPGCNAGGQGENCRYCGFEPFQPCPSTETTTTTTKATLPEGPTTTTTTTPRTTIPKTTKEPVEGGSNGGVCCDGSSNGLPLEFNEYGERLIFEDNFEFLDFKKWRHDITLSGGGNWEFQMYHNNRSNSFVENGVLHIKPTLTADAIGEANLRNNYRMDLWGGSPADQCTGNNFYGCERTSGAGGNILNPIQSAKLTTSTSFSFKYGRVEVKAKLPRGDWLWPAIWCLPVHNSYGMWPASGEIDIMESRGNENYPTSAGGGVNSFGSTLHWGADWTHNRFESTHNDYHHSSRLSDEFHTYGLYWSEDRLYTYIDNPNNVVLNVDTSKSLWEAGNFPSYFENPWRGSDLNAPFNHEFYIILNLAVGGTAGYFPDGVAGKPWSNKSPSSVNEFYNAKNQWYPTWNNPDVSFQIDSVKVWSFE